MRFPLLAAAGRRPLETSQSYKTLHIGATSHSHSHKIHLKFLSRIQESGKLDTRYNCVLLSVEYLAFFLLLLQFFFLNSSALQQLCIDPPVNHSITTIKWPHTSPYAFHPQNIRIMQIAFFAPETFYSRRILWQRLAPFMLTLFRPLGGNFFFELALVGESVQWTAVTHQEEDKFCQRHQSTWKTQH